MSIDLSPPSAPPPDDDPFIPPEPDPGENPFVSDQGNISDGGTTTGNGGGDVTVLIELSDTAEDFLTTTQKSVNKKGFSIV